MQENRCFKVVDSTLDSLREYEYCGNRILRGGMLLILKKSQTGERKRFFVEYAKKVKGGYILKNSNNTIKLKRI